MYSIIREPTGEVYGAKLGNTSFSKENPMWQDFLKWNDAQLPENKLDLSDHEPEPLPLEERRKQEYQKQGATTEALVVALWESVIENRPQAAEALQAIRNAVKVQIPKGQ